jgi:F-type H+-transporting ATPase subunit a
VSGGILASTITIGNHWQPRGFNVNLDDVIGCAVAGLLVIGIGLILRHQVTSGVPGRLQTIYEGVVEAVQRQASAVLGERARPFIPLVVTLFFFILLANWLEMIPSQPHDNGFQYLPAPTGDVNMTYALAVIVIVLVHYFSVRSRGIRGYFGHYAQPYKALIPINVIEEIAKPVTLALRLFGNIFAGGLMLILFAGLFSAFIVPVPDVVWKLFDGLFVGPIQAFIFSLLTILYFEAGMSTAAH